MKTQKQKLKTLGPVYFDHPVQREFNSMLMLVLKLHTFIDNLPHVGEQVQVCWRGSTMTHTSNLPSNPPKHSLPSTSIAAVLHTAIVAVLHKAGDVPYFGLGLVCHSIRFSRQQL